MEDDFQILIKQIEARLAKTAMRYYSNFYIGITDEEHIAQRLFTEHGLIKGQDWCISVNVGDTDLAHRIKQYFLKKGMRGSLEEDDADADATIVYFYLVTQYTVESVKSYERVMQ